MIEAEPAVVSRSVKTRRARPRRPEFTRLDATRRFAAPVTTANPSMESIVLHGFHMASDLLEVKPKEQQ